MPASLSPPEPLRAEHELNGFDSGRPTLDDWLRRRALANQKSGASRTYVVCAGMRVLAYYAVASGELTTKSATGGFRRNMPDPIPVAILARLAVDVSLHRQGVGRALFRDAAKRILSASDAIGIRGLIVHALDDDAVAFYRSLGLVVSPQEPRTLMITLSELQAAL